jgi:hypothetical protein
VISWFQNLLFKCNLYHYIEDLGHVPDLEETEQAQVAMAVNGESDVPKDAEDGAEEEAAGGGGASGGDGGDGGGGGGDGGEAEGGAAAMTASVEAGSATDAPADAEAGAGAEAEAEAGAEEGAAAAAAEEEEAVPNAFAAAADAPAAEEDAAPAAEEEEACGDKSPHCGAWKQDGQCTANPRFMVGRCTLNQVDP